MDFGYIEVLIKDSKNDITTKKDWFSLHRAKLSWRTILMGELRWEVANEYSSRIKE